MLTLRHLAPGEAWPGGKGGSVAEAKAGGKPAAKPPTGGAKLSLVVRRQASDTPLGISLSDDNVITRIEPGSAADGVLQVCVKPSPYPSPNPNPDPTLNLDPDP